MDTQGIHFLLDYQYLMEKILEKNPQRGDIIVFKLPGKENINYVKRLVALPGETIRVEDGLIHIKKNNEDNLLFMSKIKLKIFMMTSMIVIFQE